MTPRVPPHDLDAEESVLGAMMLSERALDDALSVLRERDFYRSAHARVFHAARLLHSRGEPVDAITVTSELAAAGKLEEVGGAPFIHGLAAGVPSASNARQYARIVREKARQRVALEALVAGAEAIYAGDDPLQVVTNALDQLSDQDGPGRVITMREAMESWVEELRRDHADGGITLPWETIRRETGVIRRGEVLLIGARTGIGKTFTLQTIERHVLITRRDIGSLFLTLEMPPEDIAERAAAQAKNKDPRIVADIARDHDDPIPYLVNDAPYLERCRIVSGTITADQIAAKIREARRTGIDPALVLVDYLGLLDWAGRANATMYERVSDTVRKLKGIALRERVVLVVAAQLSRAAGDGDQEVHRSHFRDSGAIEEAVDRILALWRPTPEAPDTVAMKIVKNRKGPEGSRAPLRFTEGRRLEELPPEEAV